MPLHLNNRLKELIGPDPERRVVLKNILKQINKVNTLVRGAAVLNTIATAFYN
jgi:hypothetical protein